MAQIAAFRDAEASLWQTVAEGVLAKAPPPPPGAVSFAAPGMPGAPAWQGRADLSNPFVEAAAVWGQSQEQKQQAPHAMAMGAPPGALALPGINRVGAFFSEMASEAQALARQVAEKVMALDEYRQKMRDKIEVLKVKYGNFDPGWLEAAMEYAKYYLLYRQDPPYRVHATLDDFVTDDQLPAKGTVALLADWGTGQPAAAKVLQQIASKDPRVVVHLGDIYYAGARHEMQGFFWQIWDALLQPKAKNRFTFSLSGNHDMYAGGAPYYELLDQLEQPASYFCLRNPHWQFIGLDTGYHGRYLPDRPTYLQDTEVQWLAHKFATAGQRRTVLLSHHPLYSAFEDIGGQPVNAKFHAQLKPILPPHLLWFWGHEHALTIYEEHLGVLGRCIGNGAIPVANAGRKKFDLPFRKAELGRTGPFYNNGYAMLHLDGPSLEVLYYQDSDEETALAREEFMAVS